MSRLTFISLLVVLSSLISIQCVKKVTTSPSIVTITPKTDISTEPAWELKWKKVLTEAQKEKRLVIFAAAAGFSLTREPIVKIFADRFGIDVEFVLGSGPIIAQRLFSERRAGIYNVDVILMGATTSVISLKPAGVLGPVEPLLILPEVLDPNAWLGKEIFWLDKEHSLLGFDVGIHPKILINTDLVSEGELKSIRDLFNPKWKGKIVMADPTRSGPNNTALIGLGIGPLGWDLVREFIKIETVIISDDRQTIEWVARGKYPIAFSIPAGQLSAFKSAGAPIKLLVPSDAAIIGITTGVLSLVNKAPHPNAASLFINWFLTKEGQKLFSNSTNIASRRLDGTGDIDPVLIPDPNIKYRSLDTPEFFNGLDENTGKLKDIFLPYMRK